MIGDWFQSDVTRKGKLFKEGREEDFKIDVVGMERLEGKDSEWMRH